METSRVRKFWTSNPFYPELSGALVTFYTIVIFVCSRVFLIWIPLPFPPTYLWGLGIFYLVFFCLFVCFGLPYLFYLLVEIQKKQNSTKQIQREKKYFHHLCFLLLFFFLPTPLFFFFLVLIISGHLKKNECAAEIPSLVLIRNSWLAKTSKGDIR